MKAHAGADAAGYTVRCPETATARIHDSSQVWGGPSHGEEKSARADRGDVRSR